jgi:hypothetical protein
MRVALKLIAGMLLVASCMGNTTNKKRDKTDTLSKPALKEAYQDTVGVQKLSPEECKTRLGQTLSDSTFTLEQPLTEFRISIYNHIPKASRYSTRVKIRELIWQLKGQQRLCIWYLYQNKKWIYLDRLTYADSAVF